MCIFRCCICKKESITIVALRAHLRVHEVRQTPKQNACNLCNKKFFSKHHLNRHMKLIHGIGKIYKLNKKKEIETNWNDWLLTDIPKVRHNLSAVHPDSERIKLFFDMQCDVCKMQLFSLQHAKLHYLEEHDIPDGYLKCCEMKFRELKSINDHLEYHVNPNIFK